MSDNKEIIVGPADGSFYKNYKAGLLEFLSFVEQTGEDAVSGGHLQRQDLEAVQRGLSTIRGSAKDLFPLLSKRLNEANPSFFDECTIENIWNILGAVFLIAQHSGFTDSAKVYAHTLRSSSGGLKSAERRGKRADKDWRDACLDSAITIRRSRPSISTAALSRQLYQGMLGKPGTPADCNTVVSFLAKMEREGRLPKKILRTASDKVPSG